jgi:delta 1-pyrroline-5-carboxylate dehydrogenase
MSITINIGWQNKSVCRHAAHGTQYTAKGTKHTVQGTVIAISPDKAGLAHFTGSGILLQIAAVLAEELFGR